VVIFKEVSAIASEAGDYLYIELLSFRFSALNRLKFLINILTDIYAI